MGFFDPPKQSQWFPPPPIHIPDIVQEVKNDVNDAVKETKTTVERVQGAISHEIAKEERKAEQIANNEVDHIADGFNKVADDVEALPDFVKNEANTIVDAAQDEARAVQEGVTDAVNDAVEALPDAPDIPNPLEAFNLGSKLFIAAGAGILLSFLIR